MTRPLSGRLRDALATPWRSPRTPLGRQGVPSSRQLTVAAVAGAVVGAVAVARQSLCRTFGRSARTGLGQLDSSTLEFAQLARDCGQSGRPGRGDTGRTELSLATPESRVLVRCGTTPNLALRGRVVVTRRLPSTRTPRLPFRLTQPENVGSFGGLSPLLPLSGPVKSDSEILLGG